MTVYVHEVTVPIPPGSVASTALGADANGKFTQNDVGKPVKLAAANNYVLCADGDSIEGFVTSVEPWTVNDGFSFGGVQRWGRFEVYVGAGQTGNIAIGALVVADAQTALNTAGTPKVKTGTPANFKWRVIRIMSGTGATGDKVLIEKI